MSTKQSTNSSSQGYTNLNYNPAAEGVYNNLVKSGGSVLNSYINNPFGNSYYRLGLGQSVKGAQAQGNNATQALLQNMKVQGLGGRSGNAFQTAQLGKIGRYTGALTSQANLGNVQSALGRQLSATQMGLFFNPQLSGETTKSNSNQTTTTSGLGTWLPSVLGAAAGFATGGFGGLSGLAGGAAGATQTGVGSNPSVGNYSVGGNPISIGGGIGSGGGFSPGANPFWQPNWGR